MARPARRPTPPLWTPRPARPPQPEPTPQTLRVLTWNLLFDLYDPERVRLPQRWRALNEAIVGCEADLIGLQELTPPMWGALSQEPWARRLWASEPSAGDSLGRYGQVLLSPWPIRRSALTPLSRDKKLVLVELSWGGLTLHAANVHLSSDIHADGVTLRRRQLEELARALSPLPDPVLLLGDFNFGDEEPAEALHAAGFVDLWRQLHPEDPGFSFDVQRNSLAGSIAPHIQSRRLDRVWLRDKPGSLSARSARLIGTEAIPGLEPSLYCSDHFGVLFELSRGGSGR